MSENHATFLKGDSIPRDGEFHIDPSNPVISVRWLESWHPPGVLQVLSGGNTAKLGLLPDGSVLKYPFDRNDLFLRKALDIEHSILLELGPHERIVTYLGKEEHGLRFALATNSDVRHYMSAQQPGTISLQMKQKWVEQVVEGLAFVHSKDVIHCDIHPNNFLLDEHLDLRLCDFSGSLFGELDGAAMESTRYFLPRNLDALPNVRSDLFALGSAMYYILTGYDPYNTLSDDKVVALYSQGIFPDVDGIAYGHAISGCWKGLFSSAQDVRLVLDQEKALAEVELKIGATGTTSPARPSDQWPKLDWSQLPQSSTIEKIISTGNWEYLRSEASRLHPSTQQVPCSIDLTRLTSGRQNVVFEISFSDGTYWVVRVSLTQDVEMQMLSEVATINLLLGKKTIPVPSVLGFNCQNENPFGFPYMFMSALSGRTLDKTFALSVPEQHKPKVAGQLARYWYELSQVTFDQIGRIWGGPGADDDLRIISLPWFGARDGEPGLYDIGPFKTSGAYFSGIRQGMNDLLRAQHRDAWPQWSGPCQALTDAIPSLTISPRHRRGRFPLSHPDFHYGNLLVDDDYNITGIIDWTNAHTVPVEVFATWGEIMIPGSASNEVKAAIAQFRDLFTKALKNLESAAEPRSMSLAISSLLDSSMLTVVHRWLVAVGNVPHTLRALLAYADMVMRALYGDGTTVENYKSVRRNKQKHTSGGLGALECGSAGTG